MGTNTYEIFRLVLQFGFVLAIYWLGWRSGEAAGYVWRKKFNLHLRASLNLISGWHLIIPFLLLPPLPLLVDIFRGVILRDGYLPDSFFYFVNSVPMLAGMIAGAAFNRSMPDRNRRWLIGITGTMAATGTLVLLNSWFRYYDENGILPASTTRAVGVCGIVVVLVLAHNVWFALQHYRTWNNSSRIVSPESVPEHATAPLTKQRLQKIAVDGEALALAPPYKPRQLITAYVDDEKTPCQVLPVDAALFLLFSDSINEDVNEALANVEVEASKDLTLRAVWFKVDWQNVELLTFEKIWGYAESRLKLKNSGSEVTIYAAPKMLLHCSAEPPPGVEVL